MSDLLHPLKALTLLRRSYRRENNSLQTVCPDCGGRMYIVGRSFVCEQTDCGFSRGSAIDLMKHITGSYVEAISLASESVPYYVDRVQAEARLHARRRKLLEFGFMMERENFNPVPERLRLKNEFENHNHVTAKAFSRGHWFLTAAQSTELVLILAEMEVDPPSNLQGRPTAIAPMWGNLHTISELYVVASGMNTVRSCSVTPFRCAWFGLPQMHPSCSDIDIFPSYIQAMENLERFTIHEMFRFPTQVHVNPTADLPGMDFASMRFHASGQEWLTELPTWSFVPGFEDAEFFEENQGSATLVELLERLFHTHSVSGFELFADLCGAMKLGTAARAHLMSLTACMANQWEADLLRETLARKLLEQDEDGALYETATGYELQKGESRKKLSNFTLEFTSLISFSALEEMIYVGRAFIGDEVLDLEIPSRSLDNPGAIVDMIGATQIQKPGGDAPDKVLAIVPSTKAFKRVLELLRARASKLPRSRGVHSLGWNHKHDTYITPLAIVDSSGVSHGVRYHAPKEGDHHCYSSDGEPPGVLGDMPVLDPALAELVSTMVAQVMRFYHGLPVRLFPLQNNADTRPRGLQLFSGFGQVAPLRLRNVLPANLNINRGMPCLIAPLNELQAAKARIAGAWLSDRGLDLFKFPADEIDAAAVLLPALVQEMCRRLLAGEAVSYREKRSVRPLSAMGAEGAALIQKDFWEAWPQAGVFWAAIDRILDTREKDFRRLARVDDKQDAVLLPEALWAGLDFDQSDLVIELGLLCDNVTSKPKTITVDRSSMYRLLDEFYGDVPKLQTV